MQCYVYRSLKKPGLYVYLPEKDNFSALPAAVQTTVGELAFALELSLDEHTRLATEDPRTVIDNIKKQGLHIQMPSDLEPILAMISDGDTPAE
ncbi:MAG TPA: hypothetical protein DD979_17240 [Gammaproteobacteria bacterium]|jgi:uncharacterized protein YcgL (UPF0745 family)|nr:hypothetical protein [Gammaproteobacteria bacterium]